MNGLRLLVALLVLASSAPAAGVAGRRPTAGVPSPLEAPARELTLLELGEVLDRIGYSSWKADERGGFVFFRARGENGILPVYLVPTRGLLHVQLPRLVVLSPESPRVPGLLAVLNDLNWQNTLGRYARDPGDGEVRYSVTLVAPGGLPRDALEASLSLALRTVDRDLPRLRRAAGSPAPGLPRRP